MPLGKCFNSTVASLMGLALSIAMGTKVHAEPVLELFVANAPRPGIVEGCEMFFFAKTAIDPWKKVTEKVRLNWRGGGVMLNPGASPHKERLREQCFKLVLDGEILAGGALISEQSARRLDFSVLVESSKRLGGATVVSYKERWPAGSDKELTVPVIKQLRDAFQ